MSKSDRIVLLKALSLQRDETNIDKNYVVLNSLSLQRDETHSAAERVLPSIALAYAGYNVENERIAPQLTDAKIIRKDK